LLQAAPKECYEATVPSDVPDDIKAECGDLEVLYVKKPHHYDYTVQIWALSGLK
jgi:hypothetical protein